MKARGSEGELRKEGPSIRGERPRLHRTRFVTKVGSEIPDERLSPDFAGVVDEDSRKAFPNFPAPGS